MKFSLGNYSRIAKAALTRRVPVYAHFGITHRCNLTCKMCGIWRYGNKKEELSLDEIGQMARKMHSLGVVQLSIGGGEPFAYEDIEDAVGLFAGAGLNVRLLTNGIGYHRSRIDTVIAHGVRSFSISLDSLYPARFDYICEKEGAWDEAVKTICHVGNALHGLQGALPSINCVVSNLNLDEIPDLIRFAREVGFAISLLPVELLPDAKAGVRNWEARFIRYRPEMGINSAGSPGQVRARIDQTYDKVIQMKKDGFPVLNSTPYLKASAEYLKTGRFPAEGCDAGRLYFSVAPNGQFTVCHRTVHQHLHFLDPGFEDYFHSAVYERARMQEVGSCEGCMRACWIDTSAMFRTVQGFMETAGMVALPKRRQPLSYEEACSWARHDSLATPGQAAPAEAR